MRADRLVSLVLLLRQRGRLTADTLAAELEVSTRTVLRDIEALSTAGVPVYAERGRHGGFALLPGFRTELTGLTPDEALALLTSRNGRLFGLGPALDAAMRKVVDALPADATEAARRFLTDPETDLLASRRPHDQVADATMRTVRQAVLSGHRLRIDYQGSGLRTIDPLGLVTARDRSYLLALRDGEDRTYRLSRMASAEQLPEPAQRPTDIDLNQLWKDRCARFLSENHITACVRVNPTRRDDLLNMAVAVRTEALGPDGWPRLEVTFQDLRHAVWALWQLGPDAEAQTPQALRTALHNRAASLVARYAAARSGPAHP